MVDFVPQDPEFESRVRASFASLTRMKTVGARLLRVSPILESCRECAFRSAMAASFLFRAGQR
jgi:hypothetical protein